MKRGSSSLILHHLPRGVIPRAWLIICNIPLCGNSDKNFNRIVVHNYFALWCNWQHVWLWIRKVQVRPLTGQQFEFTINELLIEKRATKKLLTSKFIIRCLLFNWISNIKELRMMKEFLVAFLKSPLRGDLEGLSYGAFV